MQGCMLRVTIPGSPVAQGRGRIRRWGYRCSLCGQKRHSGIRDPDESKDWKETAALFYRRAVSNHPDHDLSPAGSSIFPLEGPLEVRILAGFHCPKSRWLKRSKRPAVWHTSKPDADNVAKIALDAGSGIAWNDDAVVAALRLEKVTLPQGVAPYVAVWVTLLESPPEAIFSLDCTQGTYREAIVDPGAS